MTDTVRFIESDQAIKFAPQYVAEQLGFFQDAGIVIRYGPDPGPGGSALADRLVEDAADVALGGVWLPLLYRELGVADLTPFAQLCDRNPAVFLSRGGQRLDDLEELAGKRVLLSMAATSQWMFLSRVLLEKGVDLRSVKFVRDLDVQTTQRLWGYGYCDYYLVDPLRAVRLSQTGSSIAASLAHLCGRVPWSVYYAGPGFTGTTRNDRGSLPGRYREAVSRAVAWIGDTDPEKVADLLAGRFPSVDAADLAAAVSLIGEFEVWRGEMTIAPEPLRRYEAMMVDYGLLTREPDPLPLEATWH